MKKLSIAFIAAVLLSGAVYANQAVTIHKNPGFAPVNWGSASPTDVVSIQNGTGRSITISINVNSYGTGSGPGTGINVQNCGTTTHINPGSGAVCLTNSAADPVSFSTDGKNSGTSSGTYQVELSKSNK